MPGPDELAQSLNAVAVRLRELGDEGLARELQAAVGRAVDPLKDRIPAALRPHLPDRYADTLDAELKVSRSTSLGAAGDVAQVTVLARTTGIKKRKLVQLDDGILNHPVFAQGLRRRSRRINPEDLARKLGVPVHLVSGWNWVNGQTGGVRAGWFTDPVEESVPAVREAVEQALDNVIGKAAGE